MLAIRLARTGKKHQAYFRIVVSDSRKTPTAKFVEILGNYDPHTKKVQINEEKLEHYLKNGAQPSNTVAKILKTEKIALPKWVKITEKTKAPKKVKEAPAESAQSKEEKEAPKEGAKEETEVVTSESNGSEASESAPDAGKSEEKNISDEAENKDVPAEGGKSTEEAK